MDGLVWANGMEWGGGVGCWHRLYDRGAWQDKLIARGHNDLWMIQYHSD